MPSLDHLCPNCGHKTSWEFGETVVGERLVWHASSQCDNCGYTLEEDDEGPLPDHLRAIVLTEQGEWRLYVEASEDPKALILKVLRETLALSLSDVATLKEHIPGVVRSGTQAEMEWLRRILARQAINTAVLPPQP